MIKAFRDTPETQVNSDARDASICSERFAKLLRLGNQTKRFKYLFACALIATGTSAAAQTITCTAHSKLVGQNAAGGSSRDRARIVDSWIPSSFELTEEALSYEGWNPIPLSSRSASQATAHMNTEMRDSKGRKKKISVRYDVTLQPDDGQAVVYMRAKGFKTMGPVVFNCDY